jgi:hypothetical protein
MTEDVDRACVLLSLRGNQRPIDGIAYLPSVVPDRLPDRVHPSAVRVAHVGSPASA